MSLKANYFKLGLFVIGAVVAGAVVLVVIGSGRWFQPKLTIETYFNESVQGLDVGSPVKFRGVTVGNVADITIAPDHRHVQVTSGIYVDAIALARLPKNFTARRATPPPSPRRCSATQPGTASTCTPACVCPPVSATGWNACSARRTAPGSRKPMARLSPSLSIWTWRNTATRN